ncbi:MAG: hypothetical protein M4579_001415 [Chaenotheca gracillima]|nr:MAG: hypothetical protein M4579_001415 [Chaenotheca gracillima]
MDGILAKQPRVDVVDDDHDEKLQNQRSPRVSISSSRIVEVADWLEEREREIGTGSNSSSKGKQVERDVLVEKVERRVESARSESTAGDPPLSPLPRSPVRKFSTIRIPEEPRPRPARDPYAVHFEDMAIIPQRQLERRDRPSMSDRPRQLDKFVEPSNGIRSLDRRGQGQSFNKAYERRSGFESPELPAYGPRRWDNPSYPRDSHLRHPENPYTSQKYESEGDYWRKPDLEHYNRVLPVYPYGIPQYGLPPPMPMPMSRFYSDGISGVPQSSQTPMMGRPSNESQRGQLHSPMSRMPTDDDILFRRDLYSRSAQQPSLMAPPAPLSHSSQSLARYQSRRRFEEDRQDRRIPTPPPPHEAVMLPFKPPKLVSEEPPSEWLEYLKSRSLLADENDGVNWSGKGQHVEFSHPGEVPLVAQKVLGYSANCLVEQCRFKKFIVARKKIQITRRMTKEDALIEVEHLQRLRHPHIVQMIGSYVLRREFAILLYPAAEFNLEEFMDMCSKTAEESPEKTSLFSFTSCLLEALRYIHSERIKHMDIKPKNALVRPIMNDLEFYRVYLADFGIAKGYKPHEDMETNGVTAFTKTYCAPEVAIQETRGPKADIFSLGCVFSEIFTVLANKALEDFVQAREVRGDGSFHNNLPRVIRWLAGLEPSIGGGLIFWPKWFSILKQMMETEPSDRPAAFELLDNFKALKACCKMQPTSFDADYRQVRDNDRGPVWDASYMREY